MHAGSGRHLLTPAMADPLDKIGRADRAPFHTQMVPEARAAYEAASEVLELPRAPLARVQDIHIPAANATPLAARLHAASTNALPVLLYLHGGPRPFHTDPA